MKRWREVPPREKHGPAIEVFREGNPDRGLNAFRATDSELVLDRDSGRSAQLMTNNLTIPDIGAKIELLLRSDRSAVKTNNQLAQKLRIGHDYLSRIRSGTRIITEERFIALCELFKMEQREWFDDLETFGARLGFTRKQIAIITQQPLPGIDFSSRIRDRNTITDLFHVIEGYWESFYYSVSTTNRQLVSRDLMTVRRINDDNYIECEINDSCFRYVGWCCPIKSHLYFILEKKDLFNEIIVYATNWPDRHPPRLYGIILCLSGGVDETHSFASAARVAFRYLGRGADLQKQLALSSPAEVEPYLDRTVPAYVDPRECGDEDTARIIRDISNVIAIDSTPFALRMTK